MEIITHEVKSSHWSNIMRAPLTNHDSLGKSMLFGLKSHPLNDTSLLFYSKFELTLHIFDKIIIEKDFLLELLNRYSLQEVAHRALLFILSLLCTLLSL